MLAYCELATDPTNISRRTNKHAGRAVFHHLRERHRTKQSVRKSDITTDIDGSRHAHFVECRKSPLSGAALCGAWCLAVRNDASSMRLLYGAASDRIKFSKITRLAADLDTSSSNFNQTSMGTMSWRKRCIVINTAIRPIHYITHQLVIKIRNDGKTEFILWKTHTASVSIRITQHYV
jgi:hypothetical protein